MPVTVIRVILGPPARSAWHQRPELSPEERERRTKHNQRVLEWTKKAHATTRRQRESGVYGPKWTTLRAWYATELRKRYPKKATFKALGATLQLSATRVNQLVRREAKRRETVKEAGLHLRGEHYVTMFELFSGRGKTAEQRYAENFDKICWKNPVVARAGAREERRSGDDRRSDLYGGRRRRDLGDPRLRRKGGLPRRSYGRDRRLKQIHGKEKP